MSIWDKLSQDPAYFSFHGATLEMLDMTKKYMHFRFCIEGGMYQDYPEDLKEEYLDPGERELFVDMVLFSAVVLKAQSTLPPKINFGDVYFVSALEHIGDGVYALGLYTHDKQTYSIKFRFAQCMVKPLVEMDCSFYFNHPEIFDKPFSLKAFLKR